MALLPEQALAERAQCVVHLPHQLPGAQVGVTQQPPCRVEVAQPVARDRVLVPRAEDMHAHRVSAQQLSFVPSTSDFMRYFGLLLHHHKSEAD